MGDVPLLPVVFCGGQSSRMGSEKGLLPWGSVNWLQHAIQQFSALPGPVLVSIQEHQLHEFSAFYPAEHFVTDNPKLDVRGPLCGLFSVHERNPDADLFILACDMPLMRKEIVQALYLRYISAPGHEAYFFTNQGEPEPLCGIYCSRGLEKIYSRLKNNGLERYSMKYFISQLDHLIIPLMGNDARALKNFNSLDDLNGDNPEFRL